MLIFTLPFPVSTNTYYRHNRGVTHISPKGEAFRAAVAVSKRLYGHTAPAGRLSVGVELFPPDKRTRDIDNFGGKSLMDALTNAGIIEDDSLIDELKIVRRNIVKGGMCRVFISEYKPIVDSSDNNGKI